MSIDSGLGFVAAAYNYQLQSILIKPRRQIGPFVAQVTVEEKAEDDLEITDHPVEQGAAITDHAYKRPASLIVRASWSNSPSVAGLGSGIVAGLQATSTGIQAQLSGSAVNQINDIYEKFLQLQVARTPFDVYTAKRLYKNMLIKGLSQTTDEKSENSLNLVIQLRQVIIVQTQVVSISADVADQAFPATTAPPINQGSASLAPTSRFTPGYY